MSDTETMVPVFNIKDELVGWFPFDEVYPRHSRRLDAALNAWLGEAE
jgi:hypothetical protein